MTQHSEARESICDLGGEGYRAAGAIAQALEPPAVLGLWAPDKEQPQPAPVMQWP